MSRLGPGYIMKDGKVVKAANKRLPVSTRIRQRKSKRVRVAKPGSTTHGKPQVSGRE